VLLELGNNTRLIYALGFREDGLTELQISNFKDVNWHISLIYLLELNRNTHIALFKALINYRWHQSMWREPQKKMWSKFNLLCGGNQRFAWCNVLLLL